MVYPQHLSPLTFHCVTCNPKRQMSSFSRPSLQSLLVVQTRMSIDWRQKMDTTKQIKLPFFSFSFFFPLSLNKSFLPPAYITEGGMM